MARAPRAKPSKKSVTSSVCKSPTSRVRTLVSTSEGRASAEIDRGDPQGLVHRHQKISGAQNAALVAQGSIEGLAQSDADIFDGVVLIDVEIAVALQFKIEAAVMREQFQHVIEEANAGNFVASLSIDR